MKTKDFFRLLKKKRTQQENVQHTPRLSTSLSKSKSYQNQRNVIVKQEINSQNQHEPLQTNTTSIIKQEKNLTIKTEIKTIEDVIEIESDDDDEILVSQKQNEESTSLRDKKFESASDDKINLSRNNSIEKVVETVKHITIEDSIEKVKTDCEKRVVETKKDTSHDYIDDADQIIAESQIKTSIEDLIGDAVCEKKVKIYIVCEIPRL